jgi:hypothetical protein
MAVSHQTPPGPNIPESPSSTVTCETSSSCPEDGLKTDRNVVADRVVP